MLMPIFTNSSLQNAQAINGPSEPTQSDLPSESNILDLLSFDYDLEKKLLSKQWEHTKNSIKKHRTPRTLVQLADVHFHKKNYPRARDYYIDAINLDRNYLPSYDRLIFCLSILQDYRKIDFYYREWLIASNRNIQVIHNYVLFRLFYIHKSELSTSELLTDLDEIISRKPDSFAAIDTQGFILLNLENNIELAKKKFIAALEINPKYTHSLNSLGTCFLREKNIAKAVLIFNEVLEIDDTYIPAYQNLASAYSQSGNKKLELKILQEAISKGIRVSKEWEHKIGWLFIELKAYSDAIKWYETTIHHEPNNDLLYNNLGICYLRINEINIAQKYFQKAISIFKSKKGNTDYRSLLAFYNLGRIYLDHNDNHNLELIMNDINRINHNDPFLLYLRGSQALRKKEYSEAKNIFEEALQSNTSLEEVYIEYSFILECVDRDYQKAIDVLIRSIDQGFSNLKSLNNLAYAYIRLGDFDSAKRILDRITEPLTGELLATKGMLLIRMGNLTEGNDYYQRSIEMLNDPEQKKQAERLWLYEQAKYYLIRKELIKSHLFLNKTKSLGKSYLDLDLEELERDINNIVV